MSKESAFGQKCGCGQSITFFDYHILHCKKAIVETKKKRKKNK